MASLAPHVVALPDGTALTIRSATAADAAEALAFWRAASATTDQVMTQPHELPTLDGQRDLLQRLAEHDQSIALLGFVDGEMVARGGLEGDPHRRQRASHVCNLGITVVGPWRGRGVGTAILRAGLDWAAAHPAIEVVTLCVFSSNPRAEALYRRFGFVRDGVRPKHAQIRPGEYVDDVMMTLFVKPGLAPPEYNTYVSSDAAADIS